MRRAWWLYVGVVWASYDEYMTCGSGSERYGRHYHHFPELPCDISRKSWCESAGSQYPWSAVRRFIYENQGLMKRMYGTQRHYNVLRSELLNNLYDEMYDEMPKRQHQYQHPSLGSARSPRYQNPSLSNTLNSQSSKFASKQRGRQNSRAIKVTMEPEYSNKQQQTTTTASPKSPSKATKTQVKTTTTSSFTKMKDSRPMTSRDTTKSTSRTMARHSTTINGGTTSIPLSMTGDVPATASSQQVEETEDGRITSPAREYFMAVEEGTEPTLIPPEHQKGIDPMEIDIWTTLSDFPTDATSSTLYTTSLGQSSETESGYISLTEPETSTSASPTTHSHMFLDDLESEDGFFDEGFVSTPLDEDDLTTLTLGDRVDQGVKIHGDGADYTKDEIDLGIEEALNEDKNVGGPAKMEEETSVKKDEVAKSENLEVEMREQVADDFKVEGNVREEVKTESTTEPFKVKRPIRGINACPVKEEFVAPYWANNTRGETLALLNLYPFEQYVQWERCMYEHRQMYCRTGCRCEQQYRLHKLLAFDPSNECRGIFSDWFRFPSCCVCKCYDLPQDVFTTSPRRPRLSNDDDVDDKDYVDDAVSEEEAEPEDEEEQLPLKPGPPLANIPPQRRPRLPPRPISHISPPLSPPASSLPVHFSRKTNRQPTPTEAPEVSTLGTVDVATQHYFFNLTNYANVRFSKGRPLPLSRLPRSPKA